MSAELGRCPYPVPCAGMSVEVVVLRCAWCSRQVSSLLPDALPSRGVCKVCYLSRRFLQKWLAVGRAGGGAVAENMDSTRAMEGMVMEVLDAVQHSSPSGCNATEAGPGILCAAEETTPS